MFRASGHLQIKTKVIPGLRKQASGREHNVANTSCKARKIVRNPNSLGTSWRGSLESILTPWRAGSKNICRSFLRQPQDPRHKLGLNLLRHQMGEERSMCAYFLNSTTHYRQEPDPRPRCTQPEELQPSAAGSSGSQHMPAL